MQRAPAGAGDLDYDSFLEWWLAHPEQSRLVRDELRQQDGTVPGQGSTRYRVIAAGGVTIRAGARLNSAKVGALKFGDTFVALEERQQENNVATAAGTGGGLTSRVRFDRGWVTSVTAKGKGLLQDASANNAQRVMRGRAR